MLHFFFHYKVHSLTYSTFSVPASTVCSKRCKCYNDRRDWEVSAISIMLLMLCIIGNLLFLDREMLNWCISFKIVMKSHYYCFFEKGLKLGGQKMVITYQLVHSCQVHACKPWHPVTLVCCTISEPLLLQKENKLDAKGFTKRLTVT